MSWLWMGPEPQGTAQDQSGGCHCRDPQGLLRCKGSGPSGSKVQQHSTEAGVEVAGLSHSFLMVQIEVSLLPSESEP